VYKIQLKFHKDKNIIFLFHFRKILSDIIKEPKFRSTIKERIW